MKLIGQITEVVGVIVVVGVTVVVEVEAADVDVDVETGHMVVVVVVEVDVGVGVMVVVGVTVVVGTTVMVEDELLLVVDLKTRIVKAPEEILIGILDEDESDCKTLETLAIKAAEVLNMGTLNKKRRKV